MIVKDEVRIAKSPLVTVQVFAYNKEAYIRQCLDSIVNQKVDFEFEIIVSENPGTDKTRSICLEYQSNYPDRIILVLREENMGLFYNYFEAEKMSRGKYIARCDGDDYWCDDNKLKKQVDALEKDYNIGLCYTKCRIYNEELAGFENKTIGGYVNSFESMLQDYPIAQPSVMYRRDLCQLYFDEVRPRDRDWLMEDFPRHIWFYLNSRLHYLEDESTVYRIVSNSMSHNLDVEKQKKYYASIYDIKMYYIEHYFPDDENFKIQVSNRYYFKCMGLFCATRDLRSFYSYYRKFKCGSLMDFVRNNYLFVKLIITKGYVKLFKNH